MVIGAIVSLVLFAVLGFYLARVGKARAFLLTFLLLVLVMIGSIYAPGALPDMDTIAFGVIAFLICLPGASGLLGGGLAGWLIRRAAQRRADP